MDRDSHRLFRQLVTQWREVIAALQKMNPAAEVRPSDEWSVFQASDNSDASSIAFSLQPIVFNLPERADDLNTDLFIVAEGRLSLSRNAFVEHSLLQTHDFATRVAYFRRGTGTLEHVFGAHYDFSRDELGHPVFHAQLRSLCSLSTHIEEQYGIVDDVSDHLAGVLKTVRLPTAQMDMFSLFLQLCADHLLYNGSGGEEKEAFAFLLQRNAFLQGAGFQFQRLGTEAARLCYRAGHWYPR